jgi:hypothetical protein
MNRHMLLIKQHSQKKWGVWEVKIQAFLTSQLAATGHRHDLEQVGSEESPSRRGHHYLESAVVPNGEETGFEL